MLNFINTTFHKTKNIQKSTYFWNSLHASLSAAQSAVILIVITRTNGLKDAGIFSIAFAFASLMLFVGRYGLRRYQVSDFKEQYHFADYLGVRIITSNFMMLFCLLYCLYGLIYKDYTSSKFFTILLFCGLKYLQSFSDVFHGRMQQKGRLDVAAKDATSKVILNTIVITLVLFLTRNLTLSTLISFLFSLFLFLIFTLNISKNYCDLKPRFELKKIKGLILAGFPLFAGLFLNVYIANAPKFAIDYHLSDSLQAQYNILFMPAFAIGIITGFMLTPSVVVYSRNWEDRKVNAIKKLIKKQIIVLSGITVLGLIAGYFFGLPVLSIIFNVNLSGYKLELCIIILGGGMLGLVSLFSLVLTVIRHQNVLLYGYIIIALCTMLSSNYFIINFSLKGAAILYSLAMFLLTVIFFWTMKNRIHHENHRATGTTKIGDSI